MSIAANPLERDPRPVSPSLSLSLPRWQAVRLLNECAVLPHPMRREVIQSGEFRAHLDQLASQGTNDGPIDGDLIDAIKKLL